MVISLMAIANAAIATGIDDIQPIGFKESPGNKKPGGKPTDDVVAIVAWYANGVVNISFETYEGMADIDVALDGTPLCSMRAGTATQPIQCQIGSAPGTYTINITTTIGNAYTATLTLP